MQSDDRLKPSQKAPDAFSIPKTEQDHVHALSKGVSARGIMAELFGKKTGICRGQGGSMHMFSAEHGLVRHGGTTCFSLIPNTLYVLRPAG